MDLSRYVDKKVTRERCLIECLIEVTRGHPMLPLSRERAAAEYFHLKQQVTGLFSFKAYLITSF